MIEITAVSVLGGFALIFGLLLGYTGVRFEVEAEPIIDKIDAILPQIQCGKCGYPGCRPYAEAISIGVAEINQCPPGGRNGMLALAELLKRDPKPLNTECSKEPPETLAVIDETSCIGCTLCIKICPVDAILGAPKCMHTVITQECTACELCIASCPVDCVNMMPIPQTVNTWKWPYPSEK